MSTNYSLYYSRLLHKISELQDILTFLLIHICHQVKLPILKILLHNFSITQNYSSLCIFVGSINISAKPLFESEMILHGTQLKITVWFIFLKAGLKSKNKTYNKLSKSINVKFCVSKILINDLKVFVIAEK